MKQKVAELKEKTEISIIIAKIFNTPPLSIIDKNKQNISKNIENLGTTPPIKWTYVHVQNTPPMTAEYAFFSSACETFFPR